MIAFLRSLPQGLFWYPIVLAMLGYMIVVAVRTNPATRVRKKRDGDRRMVGGWTPLIGRARADRLAEKELERHCISLLLQATGYGGYSPAAVQSFIQESSDVELIAVLQEHLDGNQARNRQRVAAADAALDPLPPRCQIVVARLQRALGD